MTFTLRDTFKALGQTAAFDFGDPEDFQLLWEDPASCREDIVIVWSSVCLDQSVGTVNSKDFVGPLEWAAARQAAWKPTEGQSRPPKTLIIDLNPSGHAGLPARAIYDSLNPNQIPWLRVWSMGDTLNKINDSKSLIGLFDWPAGKGAETEFSPIWKNHLLQVLTAAPDTHHSLSNIIGVSLLTRNAARSLHTVALQALFRAVDLLPMPPPPPANLNNPPPAFIPGPTKAILLDDMADRWGTFIAETLNLAPSQLACPAVGNAKAGEGGALDRLLTRLETWAAQPYERRFLDRSDFCSPTEGGVADTPKEFILFLDLRFFGSEGGRLADSERSFVGRLLAIAEKLEASAKGKQLPYERIRRDEVAAAWEDGTGEKSETDGLRKALTFLARLMSLLDPSLPIILFSSSNQHFMLKELLPYANVIVGFQKPSFRQAPGEWPLVEEACREALRTAWKKGEHILKQRNVLRWLCERQPTPPAGESVQNGSRVDIFIDESGSGDDLCVGGFVLLSGEQPFDHEKFVSSLNHPKQKLQFLWGQSVDGAWVSYQQPINKLPKGCDLFQNERWENAPNFAGISSADLLGKIYTRIDAFLAAQGANLFSFGLKSGARKDLRGWLAATDAEVNSTIFDSRHRAMTMIAIETALFEHPHVLLLLEAGAKVGIHIATRDQSIAAGTLAHKNQRLDWRNRFGVTFKRKCELISDRTGRVIKKKEIAKWQTINAVDAVLILDEILTRRGGKLPHQATIDWCRAPTLVEKFGTLHSGFEPLKAREDLNDDYHYDQEDRIPPFQIHYLADWIVPLMRRHLKEFIQNCPSWSNAGFYEECMGPSKTRELLESSRLWGNGHRADAIKRLETCIADIQKADEEKRDMASSSSLILDKAACWPQELTGKELAALFDIGPQEGRA